MNVARAKASRHRAISPWLFVFILHRQICHSFRIPLQGQFFPLICYPPPLDKNESCQAQDTGFELEMPFGTRSLASQLLRRKDDEQMGTGPLEMVGKYSVHIAWSYLFTALLFTVFLPLWRVIVDQKVRERSMFQTILPESNVGRLLFSVNS